jgi:hypothetical protein
MALPITIPYTFASATGSIPLSQLDSDFTTIVTNVNGMGNGTVSFSAITNTGNAAIGTTSGSLGVGAVANASYKVYAVGNALFTQGIAARLYTAATDTFVDVDPNTYDQYSWTALASTLTFNLSPLTNANNGNKVIFRIKDNGVSRTLTWPTSGVGSFRVIGTVLPTATVVSKTLYVGCVYNFDDSVWDVIAVGQQA